MKKTLITFLALTGVAAAEGLTLNITELKSGNNMLTWTDEDVSELTSWELVFTLDSQRDALSDQDLMFFPDQARNVKFAVNANGSLEFYGPSSIFTASGATTATNSVISAAGMVTTDATPITLSFVANEKAGEIIGGTLTATAGGMDFSVAVSEAVTLTKTDGIRIWSNGAQEHFTQLSLSSLSNNVIPEPTTATLSLLALAGLAARRRRR